MTDGRFCVITIPGELTDFNSVRVSADGKWLALRRDAELWLARIGSGRWDGILATPLSLRYLAVRIVSK